MDRDVGIELEPADVDGNELLDSAFAERPRDKSFLSVPTRGRQWPEHRSGGVVADGGNVEPGFESLGRLGMQRNAAFLSAFAVDFKNSMHAGGLVAADFQAT